MVTMIIVDTNVVAEAMKTAPAQTVVTWLNLQEPSSVFLTSVTIGEIRYALRVMPPGRRRLRLEQVFEQLIASAFRERVLSFDEGAARHYGEMRGKRKELGRPLSVLGGQIAAIARAHGYSVATRNVRDLVDCGVEIINPFEAS